MKGFVSRLNSEWKHWHYKNTGLLVLSFIVFFLLSSHPNAVSLVKMVGSFGYIGAVISGIFFVYSFTVAPAAAVILHLSQILDPVLVSLFCGAGAVIGDYVIFKFLKDKVFDEVKPLFFHGRFRFIFNLFRTPHFAWALPIIGAMLIASPITDEVGIGLMGVSKIKPWQFIVVTFILNSMGIFAMIVTAGLFR